MKGKPPENGEPRDRESPGRPCTVCGWTWNRFKSEKALGCPECYQTFRMEIQRWLIKRGHTWEYSGPGPKALQNATRELEKKKELAAQISLALREEKYEEAARIRDELKRLQEGL